MWGINPEAWLQLHHQEHAIAVSDVRECVLPALELPSIQPLLVPSAYCC